MIRAYKNTIKTISLSIVAISLIINASCSKISGGDESDSDSVAKDSVLLAQVVDEAVPGQSHFNNIEDARKWVMKGDSASKYRTGIIPRMINEVPDYALKLINNPYNGFIVVDKFRMLVILYDRFGRVQKEYKMACAKNYGTKHEKADSRTPEGFFSVEGVYDSTDWLFTDDWGNQSDVKGQFGPRFIRLKIPTTSQIGIHGTCSPWSLGGRRSHGCIRISNDNILELVKLVEKGMPVIVSPGSRDMAVNLHEGYDVPAITTGDTRPTPGKYIPNPPIVPPSKKKDAPATDSIASGVPASADVPVANPTDSI